MLPKKKIFYVGIGAENYKIGDTVILRDDPVVVIGTDKSKDCIYVKLASGKTETIKNVSTFVFVDIKNEREE